MAAALADSEPEVAIVDVDDRVLDDTEDAVGKSQLVRSCLTESEHPEVVIT